MLASVVAGAVIAAALFAAWTTIGSERDDAIEERDAAIAERDAANGARESTADDLSATAAALQEAQDELARVGSVTPVAEPAIDPVVVGQLAAEVAALAEANASLADQVAEFQATLDLQAGSDPGVTVFVADQHPEFSLYVGERLSSWAGPTELTIEQNRCFGGTVVESVGLEALGAGLHSAATTGDYFVVAGAMQAAADACLIDPTLVFG